MKAHNYLAALLPPSLADKKVAAWRKALVIPGRDPAVERWDCEFFVIRWIDYGLLTAYGWELDHIVQVALGGSDDLSNLRARHWHGNRSAGADLRNALAGR
jgi:HNH endonuclease